MGQYDLLGPAFHADPAPTFARMRVDDPVYWSEQLGTWVVTRHADVARVVTDPRFSVDRGGSISGCRDPEVRDELSWCSAFVLRWMVFTDPPRHTRLRSAVGRAFTSTMVERLRPQIARAVDEALAWARPAGRLELIEDFAVPVPALVTAMLLGLPPRDVDRLKRWTADMFALFGAGVADAPIVRAAHASMRACSAYFAEVLAVRRRDGGADLISQLVHSPGELTEDDLIGLCITLVAGAYETTTHLVGNAMWALLQHPEQLARVRAEPTLVPNVVEEAFRYDTPALSVVRRATEDVPLEDAVIRRGQNVYCMLYSANRDPARYPEPDRFDVARADTRHLGLGHGIHFCLGAALSRLEAAEMLAALLQLEDLALDGDPPVYHQNLAIRGLGALRLRFRAA
jgi:cytochrome P450